MGLAAQGSDSAAARAKAAAAPPSASGTWIARARGTAYSGSFTLTLDIVQTTDSVTAVAVFEIHEKGFQTPTDLFGTFRGNRLVLHDRRDTFLLEATMRGGRLEGSLSQGSAHRPDAMRVIFDRKP